MPRVERLGVWLDGFHVAELERGLGHRIRCRYTEAALARWPAGLPLLSCSLPVGDGAPDASAFCDGLLAEGAVRQKMAAAAGLEASQALELLDRHGRDLAGALVIAADEPDEGSFGVVPYDDEGLARAVSEIDSHPLGFHDDTEFSLGGMEPKLLLVRLADGGWGRPTGGRPSTHILKVEGGSHYGKLEAEASCLRLAHAVGLTTIQPELVRIAGRTCMVVPRYDRRLEPDGRVGRIHQEDVCQALAIDPGGGGGRAKYEIGHGPTLRRVATLLARYGADPVAELDRLLVAVTFTVAIHNADAHGKNMALIHPDPGSVALAPLFDTVPTGLWPEIRTEAAMAVGGQTRLHSVTAADLVREATLWGLPEERAQAVTAAAAEGLIEAIAAGAIPPGSDIGRLVTRRARSLLATYAA